MQTLTPERIAHARQEKQWYLVSMLTVVLVNGLTVLARSIRVDNSPIGMVVTLCGMGALTFAMVMTWRLCRAIGIGVPMTVLTTVLSPISIIIEMIILLRMYSNRTGIGLTFMMGDKESPASPTSVAT